jgi:hypothetical protein
MMGLELDEGKHATALGCNPHFGDELAWRAGVLRRNSDECAGLGLCIFAVCSSKNEQLKHG